MTIINQLSLSFAKKLLKLNLQAKVSLPARGLTRIMSVRVMTLVVSPRARKKRSTPQMLTKLTR